MELLSTLSRIAAVAAPIAVDLALKAAVVLLLAAVVAGLLRTASASVRHLVLGLRIPGRSPTVRPHGLTTWSNQAV